MEEGKPFTRPFQQHPPGGRLTTCRLARCPIVIPSPLTSVTCCLLPFTGSGLVICDHIGTKMLRHHLLCPQSRGGRPPPCAQDYAMRPPGRFAIWSEQPKTHWPCLSGGECLSQRWSCFHYLQQMNHQQHPLSLVIHLPSMLPTPVHRITSCGTPADPKTPRSS